MHFFNFENKGERFLGAKVGEAFVDVTGVTGSPIRRILDYLRMSEEGRREFDAAVSAKASQLPHLADEEIRFLSVVEPESKFMCVGQNYVDHCREQGIPPPTTPIMFAKMNNALAGHRETIPLPATTTAIDFEVELAFVIGRTCHRVSRDEAMAHVAGYTIVNDVTARDHQRTDGQWVRAKSLDKFGPNGPFLVTAGEVPDPHKLAISLDLNGRRMQQSNTANLIFSIPFLIEYYSRDITLRPGDLISTGTPPGVGHFRKPPVWVQPGDLMEATVERLGTLVNRLGRAS